MARFANVSFTENMKGLLLSILLLEFHFKIQQSQLHLVKLKKVDPANASEQVGTYMQLSAYRVHYTIGYVSWTGGLVVR